MSEGPGGASSNHHHFPAAPLFSALDPGLSAEASSSSAVMMMAQRGTPATLNLDDIFGDVFFTPDGDTVFLSENNDNEHQQQQQVVVLPSGETQATNVASKPQGDHFVPMPQAGGIHTTNLDKPGQRALAMGMPSASASATTMTTTPSTTTTTPNNVAPPPMTFPPPLQMPPPQQSHHLQFATAAMMEAAQQQQQQQQKKRGRSASGGRSASERKMSEQQKVERRERNREHAKRSRIRKKFLLESLQQSVSLLKDENDKLRNALRSHLGTTQADDLLQKHVGTGEQQGLIANSSMDANKVLDDPDFSFIKALQTAQQNFVVTDPSLPDNPIVYATQGFLNLTGYTLDQVLGRNCRFLQGPDTDPKAVEKIRRSIEEGTDMSVCLLNYRVDGTTFWNQFFIAALRDASGNVTNYVGVQCKVSDQYAANVIKKQAEEDAKQQEEQDETMGE